MDAYDGWWCEPRVVAIPAVAATAGLGYELPGVADFSIASFAFQLHTAAGGAARQVVVVLLDSTPTPVYAEAAPGTQAGGLDVVYSFAPGVLPFGTGALGFMGGSFVGKRLPQNMAVAVQVVGAAAGDLLENVRLLVHQWNRVPADYNAQVPE